MEVKVEKQIDEARKEELGIDSWSPWSKEASKFDWSYASTETGYIIEGEVIVHLPNDESIEAEAGDVVQFPEGLNCVWEIRKDLRKVYTFDTVELDADEAVSV